MPVDERDVQPVRTSAIGPLSRHFGLRLQPDDGSGFLDSLVGDTGEVEEGVPGGDDADQLGQLDPDNQDAQDDEGDDLPTDPEELRRLVLEERGRRANAQQLLGRQSNELGGYRTMFDRMLGAQPQPGAGPQPGQVPPSAGPQLPPPGGGTDPYAQALATAAGDYQTAVNAGYDPTACYQQYQQRVAGLQQAEMQRQMFGFASQLQNQQTQFAQFESAFYGAHPELADPRARRLFNLHLLQERASGMHRNPVDAYEAAQRATVTLLTEMGYEMVEEHEAAKTRAKRLGQPGARGAQPRQLTVSPEAAIQQLNAAAVATHEAGQARLRRRSADPLSSK